MAKDKNIYVFLRIGNMSPQKQNNSKAPAKRGLWLLPKIAGIFSALYMSMWPISNIRKPTRKDKSDGRYPFRTDKVRKIIANEVARKHGSESFKDLIDVVSEKELFAYDSECTNLEIKLMKQRHLVNTISLQPSDNVWCHIESKHGKRWHQVTVREYWKLLMREIAKEYPYEADEEYIEVFYEC